MNYWLNHIKKTLSKTHFSSSNEAHMPNVSDVMQMNFRCFISVTNGLQRKISVYEIYMYYLLHFKCIYFLFVFVFNF